MSIIITETTLVCVQGITGTGGTAHTRAMLDNGTRIVAGISPGHGGETVHGVPVFETCHEAVRATGATFSVSFVGRRHACDAVLEAADAGLRYVVCMEEFVPLLDALKMRAYCAKAGCTLIGPNTNGLIAPGRAAIGFFPREFARPCRRRLSQRNADIRRDAGARQGGDRCVDRGRHRRRCGPGTGLRRVPGTIRCRR
jgi:succinyl-CoA synthetase alpha subunit